MSVSAGGSPVHDALPLILVQLLFIIALSRIYAWILKPLKQPSVIAEVLAGITLGPTLFGRIPNYLTIFFPPASLPTLSVVANVGLIFFLYFVGLELDTSLLRKNIKQGFAISISAIAAPFLLGIGLAYLLYSLLATTDNLVAFLLFIGVAMSITAFPVLARILTEFNLLNERVGIIAISAAAVDDVVAWCLLALVVSIARATDPLEALYTLILLLAFFLFMITAVKKLLHTIAKEVQKDDSYSFNFIVFLIIMIFLCAWTTEVIGVHAIFGAFILGVVTPRSFSLRITERLEDLVLVVFLPAFFAYSGLRTDLGLLNSALVWGLAILVIVTACAGKFGASTLVSRCLGNSWRESCCVGFLLNTKGLVELIVLNIGLDVGVLNNQVFAIFVLMAIVTTIMTSPLVYYFWIRYHKRKKEKKKSTENTILVCPVTPASGRRMITLASVFNVGQLSQKKRLRALYLFNLSDRPSSYAVTSRIANAERQAPYNIVKQRARELRVQLKTKMMITSNAVRDICQYAEDYQSNFCFFEWDWNNRWDDEIVNADHLPEGHFPHTEAVQKLVNTPASYDRTVGLFVDKGLDQVGEINRVLIPVWPGDNIEILCSINPSVNVTVLTDTNSLPNELRERLAHIEKSHENIMVITRTPTAESINTVADEQTSQVIIMLSHGPRRRDIHTHRLVDGLVRTDSEAGVLLQNANTSVVLLGFSGGDPSADEQKSGSADDSTSVMRLEDGL